MGIFEAFFGKKVTGAEVVRMTPGRKIRVDGEKGMVERGVRDSEHPGEFIMVILPGRRHEVIGASSRRKLRTRGLFH